MKPSFVGPTVALLLTGVILSGLVFAEERTEGTGEKKLTPEVVEAGKWMTYYYLKPEPEKAVGYLKLFLLSGVLSEDTNAPMTTFFGSIFRGKSDKIADWLKELKGIPEPQMVWVWNALWYAGTKEAKDQLDAAAKNGSERAKAYLAELKKKPAIDLLKMEIGTPEDLDMLWGAFMATGNAAYVVRIISVLDLASRENEEIVMVGETAVWSLTSNAVQHELVMKTCKEQLAKQPEKVKKVLAEVIKEAEIQKKEMEAKATKEGMKK